MVPAVGSVESVVDVIGPPFVSTQIADVKKSAGSGDRIVSYTVPVRVPPNGIGAVQASVVVPPVPPVWDSRRSTASTSRSAPAPARRIRDAYIEHEPSETAKQILRKRRALQDDKDLLELAAQIVASEILD